MLLCLLARTRACACILPLAGGSRGPGEGLEIRPEPPRPVPLVRACDGNEPDSGRGVWSVRLSEARLPRCTCVWFSSISAAHPLSCLFVSFSRFNLLSIRDFFFFCLSGAY